MTNFRFFLDHSTKIALYFQLTIFFHCFTFDDRPFLFSKQSAVLLRAHGTEVILHLGSLFNLTNYFSVKDAQMRNITK